MARTEEVEVLRFFAEAAAIAFYRTVFDATERMRMDARRDPGFDSDRAVHLFVAGVITAFAAFGILAIQSRGFRGFEAVIAALAASSWPSRWPREPRHVGSSVKPTPSAD